MTKIRDILSVEQALMQALQNLSDEDVKNNTNKSKSNYRKCAEKKLACESYENYYETGEIMGTREPNKTIYKGIFDVGIGST